MVFRGAEVQRGEVTSFSFSVNYRKKLSVNLTYLIGALNRVHVLHFFFYYRGDTIQQAVKPLWEENNIVPCHNAVGYYPIRNDLIKTLFNICHIFCLLVIQPKNFYHFLNATKM